MVSSTCSTLRRFRMPNATLLRAAVIGFALSGTACESTTEPEPFGGAYTLRSSNGIDLPAPYAPGGPSTIQRGTLTVEEPATMRVTLGIGATLADASDQQFMFQYQQVGDSLIVPVPAGMGGRLVGSTVRLRIGLPAPPSMGFDVYWHDLTFRR